ncbi:MAG: hypothetical protein KF813_03605 [Trueperaceae bacterium]|nr:hypothetical protein [Trueperaceae bacterium]
MLKPRSAILRLALVSLLLVALTACGTGPTPPDGGLQDVPGQVTVPSGAGLNLATLSVVGPHGTFPVAADGKFTARVPAGVVSELTVVDADGELVLLALRDGASVVADATTTARGLLFYLLGGYLLPSDQHGKLRTLIGEERALVALADEVEDSLAAGGRPLTDEDGVIAAAIQDAWSAVLGEADLVSEFGDAVRLMQTGGSDNILIEPGAGVVQSGSSVIHNPNGSGVAAQNTIRRPAALLAYQVGYEDAGGTRHDVSPPVLTHTIDVPSTGRLELFTALNDVLTGQAPWTPVLSEGLPLVLHDGAHKTFYELVLLGPSLDAVTRPPIYDDARFSSERAAWNEIIADKLVDQFLEDIALPLLEALAFGGNAALDAAELRAFRAEFRAATDTHLAGLGIFLKAGGSHAAAIKRFLADVAENSLYRSDLFAGMERALPEATRNRLHFESMEASLKSRANASAIIAAVQLSLAAGDLAAIMNDLNDALPAVSWQATAAPTLFYLSPETAYFTKSQPQVELTVGTRGTVTGTFLYRWTTPGAFGRLTDGPRTGLSIVTPYSNVWYTHNAPHTVADGQRDAVTVEVFQVEPGTTSIPAGAQPSARMTAQLEGWNKEIDSRIVVQSGVTPSGYFRDGLSVSCSAMLLRIDKVAGVKKYNIQFSNWGGVGHEYNRNATLYRNPSPLVVIDPINDPDNQIREFEGPCVWRTKSGELAAAPAGFTIYDAGTYYLVNIQTAMAMLPGSTIPPGYIGLGGQVQLWYEWAARGKVTVTVVR